MPSRQREYQLRHQAAGLCQQCSTPLTMGSPRLCERHLAVYRARDRARYQQRGVLASDAGGN